MDQEDLRREGGWKVALSRRRQGQDLPSPGPGPTPASPGTRRMIAVNDVNSFYLQIQLSSDVLLPPT
jgi:hypothetical protein